MQAVESLLRTPKEFRNYELGYLIKKSNNQLLRLVGHNGTLFTAEFSPNGKRIVTASEDFTARIWDAETGNELNILQHSKDMGCRDR